MLATPVLAGMNCEWSADNVTFRNISVLDTSYKEGLQYGLQQDTVYYFRCKNDTTLYGYASARTREGLDSMGISLIAGIGIMVIVLFWFAFKLESEHFILKLLLILGAMSLLILIPISIINPDTTGTTFYKVYLWLFTAFWLYIGGYIVWWLYYHKLRRVVQG